MNYSVSSNTSSFSRNVRFVLAFIFISFLYMGVLSEASAQYSYIFISNLTFNPSSVTGGSAATGTVTISSPAPIGGLYVSLSSSAPLIAAPPTGIYVPQGQYSATFSIPTSSVSANTVVTITASAVIYGGYVSTRTATLTVLSSSTTPLAITSISVSPNPTQGGKYVSLKVFFNVSEGSLLSNLLPTNGFPVALTCSNNHAAGVTSGPNSESIISIFPVTLMIYPTNTNVTINDAEGSVTIYLKTSTVNYQQTFTITATGQSPENQVACTMTLLPANMWVDHYVMPNMMKLKWDVSTYLPYLSIVRSRMVNNVRTESQVVGTFASNISSFDDIKLDGFENGAVYLYEIFPCETSTPPQISISSMGIRLGNYASLSGTMITPYKHTSLDNQTVDSRIDLRYSELKYQDYKFGQGIYRGGLYAGMAAGPDRSGVGRSFVKYHVGQHDPLTSFRAGDINLYYTGSNKTITNVPISCVSIPNLTWTSPELVWTSAPSIPTVASPPTYSFNWNLSTPTPKWVYWSLFDEIRNASVPTGQSPDNPSVANLSVALLAPVETNPGWVYFAKREYDNALAPALTHVWDWAIPVKLYRCITPIYDSMGNLIGRSGVFSVIVNGLNPGEQVTVALKGSPNGLEHPTNPDLGSVYFNVTVTSLVNTFTSYYVEGSSLNFPFPYKATYNGVTVYVQDYPNSSPCNGSGGGSGIIGYGGGFFQ